MKLAKSVLLLAAAQAALSAHTGVGETSGFMHGFSHPIGGLDHFLAMIAVGLWASLLGGRSLFIVPIAFVTMMVAGGFMAFSHIQLPYIEMMILTSVVALGLLIAFGVKVHVIIGAMIVGGFGVFHGFAHGAEMPVDASGFVYGVGFVIATSMLHAIGISIGMFLQKLQTSRLSRVGGAAIATGGLLLAFA